MSVRRAMPSSRYGSPIGIFLFLLPGLGMYTVLLLYPSLLSLYFSVLKWDGGPIGNAPFVGVANFQQLLSDSIIPIALGNNARLLLLCWLFQLPMALVLAFAITRLRHGGSVYRFVFFLPVIVPTATMALMWGFIFSGNPYGVLNATLRAIGLGGLIQRWLSMDGIVQWTTTLPAAWVGIGFFMTIFIAALVGIPQELYEAAAIDGATGAQQLLYITLPTIRGIYVAGMVLALQTALGSFIYPYLITNGGPLHLSETLISYSLFLLWTQRSWGYGSAVAVLSFVLSIIITGFVLRFSRPRETEDVAPRIPGVQ
jgi:raffinose/stachyose/melibiose transport system permease protein